MLFIGHLIRPGWESILYFCGRGAYSDTILMWQILFDIVDTNVFQAAKSHSTQAATTSLIRVRSEENNMIISFQ